MQKALRHVADGPPAGNPSGERELASVGSLLPVALVFLALTLLVWGLFAFDRGLWQDDVSILSATSALSAFRDRFFTPITTPTRWLVRFPYALALLTRSPVVFLQALYGALWFFSGVVSAVFLLEVFPRDRWLAYLGGCLTICATGDFLVDSIVGVMYEISGVCFFASLVFLIKAWKSGRLVWMVPSAVLLSGSLWSADAAPPSVLLAPPLLWLFYRRRPRRRLAAASAIWYAVSVPYFVVFIRFLSDPHGYAAEAILPLEWSERYARSLRLFFHNFDFWSWGPARANWFPAQPRVLPVLFCAVASIIGALVFLAGNARARASTLADRSAPESRTRDLIAFAGVCCLLGFASNAPFALVRYSEFFFRTQTMSRYWISVAIAAASIAIARSPRLLGVGMAIPTLFVGFGVFGGLDRQDYYLGYWLRHRQELRSIVDAVPRVGKDSFLVLRVAGPRHYMATAAQYLTESWLGLIYDDRTLQFRSFLWASGQDAECSIAEESVVCRSGFLPRQRVFPLKRTILLKYRLAENRFVLVDRNRLAELFGVADARAYDPGALIGSGAPPRLARTLLDRPDALARFLPSLSAENQRLVGSWKTLRRFFLR